MGTLDMSGGNVSGGDYKLSFSAGQQAPGLYSGPNYKVKAGFQYVRPGIPFEFSISSLVIDFGGLTPGEPVTRTNEITVSNGSAHGYQVTAFEDHELRVFPNEANIPDTSCDNGSCTQTTSALWSNPLTYGFGYRCDNLSDTDCASGFETENYYKQFANKEIGEAPQSVMSGNSAGEDKKIQITYKINVSATQPPGSYENIITYIATPTL